MQLLKNCIDPTISCKSEAKSEKYLGDIINETGNIQATITKGKKGVLALLLKFSQS